MNITVAQRRFDSIPKGDPEAVVPLPKGHPALVGMRTLFPSTVVDAKDSPRLLVSGANNRKIGKQVAKGPWMGMPIYTLTLEERATCPKSCYMLSACYGNSMHLARRHRHGMEFEDKLLGEVIDLASEHPDGFVVRLHVLGDFYSKAYVLLWDSLLKRYPNLHVYGYTARSVTEGGDDRQIAMAIHHINTVYDTRCFIRFSSKTPMMFGATVISRTPEDARVPEGLVCPAETSDAECCATCGLCWSPPMRERTIVFVQHGKGSNATKAEIKITSKKDDDGLRRVRAFNTNLKQWDALRGQIVEIKQVNPTDLWVDERYQRNLSRKGADLITKMCRSWDWRKFKPPVVTVADDGRLHVMDGQHTAIAAASHPNIKTIPVMLVDATTLEERAETFIGINRDRVAVTPAQIFYAELAAGDAEAKAVKAMCDAADVIILRQPPAKNEYGTGETMAIMSCRRLYRVHGAELGVKVLNILVESGISPVSEWSIGAVVHLLTGHDELYTPRLSDEKIWTVIRRLGDSLLPKAYAARAEESGMSLAGAAAEIIWAEARK